MSVSEILDLEECGTPWGVKSCLGVISVDCGGTEAPCSCPQGRAFAALVGDGALNGLPGLEDDDVDATLAALEALEAREAQTERERLRQLGAPAWLTVDMSDADQLWVPHDCVSDETGACPTCAAYVAAGGVL